MANYMGSSPMKSAESEQGHGTHGPLNHIQTNNEIHMGDSHTAFDYKNTDKVVSGIAKQLAALDEVYRENTASPSGQVFDKDQPGPSMNASRFPDTAQQGNLGLQLNQLAGNLAANLVGLKVAGSLMKSATRQLSAGVQQFNTGMKGMKKGLSNFKVNGKDNA